MFVDLSHQVLPWETLNVSYIQLIRKDKFAVVMFQCIFEVTRKFTINTSILFVPILFSGKPYLFFFDLQSCLRLGPALVVTGCPTPQV
ncbi:unnamed protein product [Schistosoma mattheei]|uniref:Uncharacterized protein n=1 Tax=Schistosoma mattheei TaxID=31246 RepID=A0A183P2X3_9TREM|nr:unnamed protein product [Schistosoma mattheei]